MGTQMSNADWIKFSFFAAIIMTIIVKAYLNLRNRRHILANRHRVPEGFREKISLAEHQKAADYTMSKLNSGQYFDAFDLLLLLGWTLGGGIQILAEWATSLQYGTTLSGVLFFALYGMVATLLSLPQAIYDTFFLEERFGFNKTTPGLFIKDMVKGLLVGALIGLPILAGVLKLMERLGEYWWPVGWAFLTLVQFVLLWAYPRFIAPLFNKFTPMEEGEGKQKVLSLLEKTGFTSDGLFVMNASLRSSHGNAYFTGFGTNKRIVFFDTLLKSLTPNQVAAVLAHELGHFKCRHVIKQMVSRTILSLVGFALLGYLYRWEPFFTGHGVQSMESWTALLLFMKVVGIYTFFLTPLFNRVSRKYEFEADRFAAQHARAEDLKDALVRLHQDNASTLTPDPVYSNFYHSHPPATIRIEHLLQCQDNANQ